MTIDKAEKKQEEFDALLYDLSKYKEQKYVEAKNKLQSNAKSFYEMRQKIIEGFKSGKFSVYRNDEDSRFEYNDKNDTRDSDGLIDYEKLNRLIDLKRTAINDNLFIEYFRYQHPNTMLEDLNSTRNTERNNIQAALIGSALTDFRNRIRSMPEDEIRYKQPNEIINIVEKILEFDRQQQGGGLKILTPTQMLSRLPISLAQLKAGNNPELDFRIRIRIRN